MCGCNKRPTRTQCVCLSTYSTLGSLEVLTCQDDLTSSTKRTLSVVLYHITEICTHQCPPQPCNMHVLHTHTQHTPKAFGLGTRVETGKPQLRGFAVYVKRLRTSTARRLQGPARGRILRAMPRRLREYPTQLNSCGCVRRPRGAKQYLGDRPCICIHSMFVRLDRFCTPCADFVRMMKRATACSGRVP